MPTSRTRQQVIPRADLRGYALRGVPIEGFGDRADLPPVDRVAIARMARSYAPDQLSAEQRALLARDDARPRRVSARLRGFTENALQDEDANRAGLYAQLPARTRAAIGTTNFPLSVGQLAELVGASARQVRHWTDLALVPAHRVAGERRYFSAGAVYAAVLARLPNHQIATLATLAQPSRRSSHFVTILGATLTTLAEHVEPDEVQEELAEAGALLRHAGARMAHAS